MQNSQIIFEKLSVVCVTDVSVCFHKDSVPNNGKECALFSMLQACECIEAKTQQFTFDQIGKNNTEILDALYNAEVLLIDITGLNEISTVLYHMGVRESVKSTVNIVLVCADDADILRSLPEFTEPNSLISYVVDENGIARFVDSSRMYLVNGEVTNVKSKILVNLPSLSSRLMECFKKAQKETRLHLSCQFVNELRFDRENLKGDELREKLRKMRRRLDDPRLLTPDSLLNMFLSYRHVDAYSEMISLVEAIEGLQNYQHLLEPPSIRYYYAFALNRRNAKGDRDKALSIIQDVISVSKQTSPEIYGLEGRIHKDRYMESNCTDKVSLEKAIECYRKGFHEFSSDYLGVNLATLLVIKGADRTNKELATVCNMLYINTGRKGSLNELQDYWDVATFFEVSVLWGDYAGAVKAAKRMHSLNPPFWHLDSTLKNICLILRARKLTGNTMTKDAELFNFWLEFFQDSIQGTGRKSSASDAGTGDDAKRKDTESVKQSPNCHPQTPGSGSSPRILFQILLADMSDEDPRPAYLHLHSHSDKTNMRICYVDSSQQLPPKTNTHRAVAPVIFTFAEETSGLEKRESTPPANILLNQTYDLVFYEDDIKGFSLNPKDKRNLYFFTVQAEDYSIHFPCEYSRTEFLASVRAALSATDSYLLDEHENDKPIQFVYETDESGHRIVLGAGSFGTVYAGRELSREVKIAIKEIKNVPQKVLQPLIEEINLQSRLNHTNIVRYLGSVYEDGVLKILMEQVPGGSLGFLLKKIGSLRDETVSHYCGQILEGLRYLHASKIVHRDIKGDNILVNMYRGELKIADFGASKRLGGLIRKAGTVTGTMRFMAPELINASKDGYGYPADIWSFGCTVLEMVTGKLPYHELDAFAAFYRAGYYSAHPDIPEDLPEPCKAFMKRCFEIDPEKRASADELLTDPFILMYKRHKSRPQLRLAASPKPVDTAVQLNLLNDQSLNELLGQRSRLHSDDASVKPTNSHLNTSVSDRSSMVKALNLSPLCGRTFSTTTCQTAPILPVSQRETSPIRTLDFPLYPSDTATKQGRRPEQRHTRERASYGGTPAGGYFGLTKAIQQQQQQPRCDASIVDVFPVSKIPSTGQLPTVSPMCGSISSPDNFNIIKSMDEAKKQLSLSLLQSKQSVVIWWTKQTATTTRLPLIPGSRSQAAPRESDGLSRFSPPILSAPANSSYLAPSRERDEHDLIECMFEFLTDALNGGKSIQTINRLLVGIIRETEPRTPKSSFPITRPPPLGSTAGRLSTSFSFDDTQPACEIRFISVVGRVFKQQQQQGNHSGEGSGITDSVVQQVLAFIERAWIAMSKDLAYPLRDAGYSHQKPHQMLTWIKLIGDIANLALYQLTAQEPSNAFRRTKTICADPRPSADFGRPAGLARSHSLASSPAHFSNITAASAAPSWISGGRRVRLAPPNSTSPAQTPTPAEPLDLFSPTDSQLNAAAESALVVNPELTVDIDLGKDGEPLSSYSRTLFGRRMQLRRNMHPPRYVKRAFMPLIGSSPSTATMSPISVKRKVEYFEATSSFESPQLNSQIVEEVKESFLKYAELLQKDLHLRQSFSASLEQLGFLLSSSLGVEGTTTTNNLYSGVTTGFPSLSKWLGELGIPVLDIEKITEHQFDQTDFLELITKDDLWRLGISGGSVLRIWGAILQLRKNHLANLK